MKWHLSVKKNTNYKKKEDDSSKHLNYYQFGLNRSEEPVDLDS